jgi:hypothetical protein
MSPLPLVEGFSLVASTGSYRAGQITACVVVVCLGFAVQPARKGSGS